MNVDILTYIQQNNGAEIAIIQQKFGFSYKEAKKIIDELVSKGTLVYEAGVKYSYVKKDDALEDRRAELERRRAEAIRKVHENLSEYDEEDDEAEEKAAAERRAYLEARRQELIRRMQAEMEENDEDDDEDDNSTTQFNDEMESVLSKANALAEQYKSSYIASEHIVFAMLLVNCKAGEILKACGCDKEIFEKLFVKTISFDAVFSGYTPRTKMIIQHAKENAVLKKGYGTTVGTEYVLYAALSSDSLASKILKAMDVNMKKLIYLLEEAMDS